MNLKLAVIFLWFSFFNFLWIYFSKKHQALKMILLVVLLILTMIFLALWGYNRSI